MAGTHINQSLDTITDSPVVMASDIFYINVSESEAPFYLYTREQEIIVTIVMPIALALGIILNCSFLFVIARVPYMRTITNYYLVNLCVADILYISFAVSDKLLRYETSAVAIDQSIHGEIGCIVVYGIMDIAYFVSILTVVLFTVERFVAITFPLRAQMMSSKKRTLILIAITWLTAIVFTIPTMVGNSERHIMHFIWPPGYDDLPEVVETCYTTSGDLAYLAVGINVIPFCLSLVIVVILNAIICIKILRENKIGESARSKSSLAARNQVVRMLFVTSILFFLLLFPFEFATISPLFDPDPAGTGAIPIEIFGAWIQYSRVLSYINSVINPIIYNAMSARYRRAFVTAFLCREAGKTEKKNTSYSTRVTSAVSSVRYTHDKSVKVGDDIPIEPVSCDSIKFNTEDTVVGNYPYNDTNAL